MERVHDLTRHTQWKDEQSEPLKEGKEGFIYGRSIYECLLGEKNRER